MNGSPLDVVTFSPGDPTPDHLEDLSQRMRQAAHEFVEAARAAGALGPGDVSVVIVDESPLRRKPLVRFHAATGDLLVMLGVDG